jgi:hypothetical protein
MVGNIVIQPPASFVASNTQLAFGAANSAGVYANASFESSNGKLSLTGGTLSGNLVVGGNVVPTTDNEHFLGSSEKRWHSLFVGPGSVDIDGIVLSNTGGNLIIDGANDLQINVGGTVVALYDKIQEVSNTSNTAGDDSATASSYANAAYAQANTGNVTAQAAFDEANTAYLTAIVAYNWGNHANAGYANSSNLAIVSDYANSAYIQANTPSHVANSASVYANAAYDYANTISGGAAIDNVARTSANSASVYANAAFDAANNATDSWVRDAANSASSYANSAFGVANNSATITYVDNAIANLVNTAPSTLDTLNELAIALNNDPSFATTIATNIGIIGDYANSAYLQANTPSTTANSASVYANAAFDAANNAVDTWVRDAANSASSYANSGFNVANTANTLAQAAYDAANNATDSWVRDASNSASSYANSAYGVANTANSTAESAVILAQAAFDQANVGGSSEDTFARVQANSAFDAANSASIYSNAAFEKANTIEGALSGGTFELSVQHDSFVADGTSNTFTISTTPINEDYLLISINGVVQHKSSYNVSTANIIFNEPPETDDAIDVVIFKSANSSTALTFDVANAAFDQANTANTTAQAAYDAANNAVDTWVRDAANSASSYANSGFSVANTANTLAQAAYDAANNATDSWVRDAANSASSYANSGYSLANTSNTLAQAAYDAANNAVDTWVRDAANSASSYANSGYAQANTGNVTAQAAFDEANTAYLTAIVAYNWGNHANAGYSTITYVDNSIANLVNSAPVTLDTLNELSAALNNDPDFATTIATNIGIIGTYANAAYLQANTPSDVANSASVYANAAFDAANNAVDTWVRDAANSASSYANSGYDQANTANTLAQAAYDAANNATDSWVRDAANSGSSYANSSYIHANAAFDYANTLVGGGSFALSVIHDSFVADGASNTYTLSTTPVGENYTLITFDGVVQHKSTYNVVSSNVEFTTVPDTNTEIDIMIFTGANVSYQAAYDHANAAYETANNATDSWVRDAANSASSYANSAFDTANNATDSWVRDAANSASSYANSAYESSNTNSSTINIVGTYANAAFDLANVSLNTQSGGSITGDIDITGNLSVTGCTASLTVTTLRTADHIIDVGYGTTGVPVENAGLRVFRGDENPVQLRWVESDNYWEYSNDGTNYIKFGSFSDGVYANAAYAEANSRATTTYVDNAIANLVNSAPSTLDTLNELAAALNNDPDFATTTITLIGETRLHANAAFDAANNAVDTWVRDAANSGSSYANSAYSHANTANTLAQAAYDAANTGGGATITFGANPPASGNVAGDSWIDSDTGVKYTYIDDADSGQWVELGTVGLQGPVANNTATTGKAIAMAIVFGG